MADSVARSGAATAVFVSPGQAYDQGLADWAKGDKTDALQALDYAAQNGVLAAQLRLAELYASGNGVPQSDAKAFGHYQAIAIRFADAGPRHPRARQIAEALVALAGYFRSGIPELEMQPAPAKAAGLYRHAASFFGSAIAQYELARMYLSGEGVNKNVRLAVNWLMNASRKQHAPSQALLGDLLWRGAGENYHQPLNGLALLSVAREHAAGTPDEAWIDTLYARTVGEASPTQREGADEIAARWLKRDIRATNAKVQDAPVISPPADASRGISVSDAAPQEPPSGIRTVGATVDGVPPR